MPWQQLEFLPRRMSIIFLKCKGGDLMPGGQGKQRKPKGKGKDKGKGKSKGK